MNVKNIQQPTFNSERRMTAGMHRRWMLGVECWLLNVPQFVLIFAIRLYRWTVSPLLVFLFGPTGGCRFTPSCSQYAVDAIRAQGVLAGSGLAIRRICRCHPWGDGGHDPAPKKELRIPNSEFRI
jgi:putative membrane protein insertion efficiency factor